jgi:hypothetical protein
MKFNKAAIKVEQHVIKVYTYYFHWGRYRSVILDVFSDRVYLEGVKEKLEFIASYQAI